MSQPKPSPATHFRMPSLGKPAAVMREKPAAMRGKPASPAAVMRGKPAKSVAAMREKPAKPAR